ncbi:hypothetical protein ACG33_07400 [Steroidobacter denitrificans]|uniref:Polysaccharide biosynthesis protein C-terminal domain-containing protein n=1 Tax=Steroidobacter denitrificans TaxID=465721 RepID=A0A127F940_STEDE|nr:oligosaccharide flippase family protein [Steroidobacter denitrificans]AMN46923.1 hypothetical protein ACG33_07400 [Steroidobacter denitrificans]
MNTLIASVRSRVRASPVAYRLAIGATWSMAGAVAERVVTFASSVVIVRLLGKESFGSLAILQSTLSMVGVCAGLGLGVTATKYVAELKERDPQRLGRILTLTHRVALASGLSIAGILAAGSGFIGTHILNMPGEADLLALSALAVLFNTLQSYQSGALIGFEAMRKNTLAGVYTALLSVPMSVSLTYSYGLAGAVWGLVLSSLVRWVISGVMLADCLGSWRIPRICRGWASEWRSIRDFAAPALLSTMMVMPVHWICHAMLINTPQGKEQMAVLGVVNQWYYALLLLPMAAGRIVLPVLTQTLAVQTPANKGSKAGANVLRLGMLANAAIVAPFAVALGVGAPFIMKLYGDSFAAEWPVLAVTVVTASLVAIQMPVGSILAASGRMWLGAVMNLGWAAVYVTGSWLLLDNGAMGIAAALLGAYIIHALWTFAFAARQLRFGGGDSGG